MEDEEIETVEQAKNRQKTAHLQPWQYKKGQSGNPKGRHPGTSLKEYAKQKLAKMNEKEREEFLNGLDKKIIWEMGEGKAQQDVTSDGKPLQVIVPSAVAETFNINGTDPETGGLHKK